MTTESWFRDQIRMCHVISTELGEPREALDRDYRVAWLRDQIRMCHTVISTDLGDPRRAEHAARLRRGLILAHRRAAAVRVVGVRVVGAIERGGVVVVGAVGVGGGGGGGVLRLGAFGGCWLFEPSTHGVWR